MATNLSDIQALINRAKDHLKVGLPENLDETTSTKAKNLIAKAKAEQAKTTVTFESLSIKTAELAKAANQLHAEQANTLALTKTNLIDQQRLMQRQYDVHALKLAVMTAEHELKEAQEDLAWMHSQFDEDIRLVYQLQQQGIRGIRVQSRTEIRYLLANERNPHLSIGSKTPLHRAVLTGNADLVRRLIADGADPNEPDLNGNYPICDIMAFNIPNNFQVLYVLLTNGAHVNQENSAGWTALNFRCANIVGVPKDPRTLVLLNSYNARGGKAPMFVVSGNLPGATTTASKPANASNVASTATSPISNRRRRNIIAQQKMRQRLQEKLDLYRQHLEATRSNNVSFTTFTRRKPTISQSLERGPVTSLITTKRPIFYNTSDDLSENVFMTFEQVKDKYGMPIPPAQFKPRTVINKPVGLVDNRNVFQAFAYGVFDTYQRTGQFVGEELARLHLGHQTKTAASITTVGQAIGEDLAKWQLGQDSFLKYMLTERTLSEHASGTVAFTKENVGKALQTLSTATANDYAEFLGRATGDLSIFWAGGKIVGMVEEGVSAVGKPLTFLRDAKKAQRAATTVTAEVRFAGIDAKSIINLEHVELIRTHPISGKSSEKIVRKLEASMRSNGFDVGQPIEVVVHNGQSYIIDGHHRYRAAKMAGVKDIPVKVIQDLKNHPSGWESIEEVIRDASYCGTDNLRLRY